MKKLVIFDAMGVIYKTGDDVKYLLYPFLKELDPGLAFEQTNGLYMKLSLGEITSKELFSSLGFGSQYPEIEKRYLDSRLKLNEGFISAAEQLSLHYEMAILSNDAAEWSAHLRKKYDLDKYFLTSVISGDVGIRKPSQEIYEILLEKTDRKAEDCIFIDDNIKNLDAAEKLGINAIWFNRNPEKSDWYGYSASNFSELHFIIKKIFP